MSRLARGLLVALSLTVALAAMGLIGLNWRDRADDICRKEAPAPGSSYTMTWKWDEFAYVCDYRAPTEPLRRVSVIDAFHSGGPQRHGG